MLKLVIVVACRSWKNDASFMENHGKIMEFDSGKALGTLFKSQQLCRSLSLIVQGCTYFFGRNVRIYRVGRALLFLMPLSYSGTSVLFHSLLTELLVAIRNPTGCTSSGSCIVISINNNAVIMKNSVLVENPF